jgi:hypothetical protein
MKPKIDIGMIRRTGFKAVLALLLLLFLASCGSGESTTPSESFAIGSPEVAQSTDDTSTPEPSATPDTSAAAEPMRETPQSTESTIVTASEPDPVEGARDDNPSVPVESDSAQAEAARDDTIHLQIGERTYSAALAANSSAQALKELLAAGPVTIDMRDYGNMEKVGGLGKSLPTNDEQTTTEPGDLILYQGNAFVIYYAANSWNFTRLGKINDVSQEELKEALGDGNVTVTLSLKG